MGPPWRDIDPACGRLVVGARFRNEARIAGYRSVQSTPMMTQDGRRLGMVSTHFATVHEPTPIEMETLPSYGAIAAEHAFRLL